MRFAHGQSSTTRASIGPLPWRQVVSTVSVANRCAHLRVHVSFVNEQFFQAAMVGFNGGNGTGWYALPYSGHGRVWKLGYFSNVLVPGRWIFRVDERIIPGGCLNASIGVLLKNCMSST